MEVLKIMLAIVFVTPRASNAGITAFLPISIYLSDNSEAPPTFNVIEQDTLMLTCQTDLPDTSITWVTSYDPNVYSLNATLQIANLRDDQSGDYTCKVYNKTNNYKLGHRSIFVNVLYRPRRVTITGPSYSLASENITLRCTSDSNPKPSLSWSRTENGGDIIHRGPVLNEIFDVGKVFYYCFAENTLIPTLGSTVTTTVKGHFEIEPQIEIIVSLPEDNYSVEQGAKLDIICDAYGHPPPTIWWTRAGNKTVANGYRLVLKSVQLESEDLYTCHAYNTVRTAAGEYRTTTSTAQTYISVYTPGTTVGQTAHPVSTTSATRLTTSKNTSEVICPQLQSECSDTIKVALVAGWIVVAILIVIGLFVIIRVRQTKQQPDWVKHHESFDQASSRPSVQYSQSTQSTNSTNTSRSYFRPNLPRRPGQEEHTYSTLDGESVRGRPDGSNPSKPSLDDDGYITPKDSLRSSGDYVVPYSTVPDMPVTAEIGPGPGKVSYDNMAAD